MAEYVFKGGGPQEYAGADGVLLIDHPLDVREFDADPGPPWEQVKAAAADEPAADIPAAAAKPEPAVTITPDGPRPPAPAAPAAKTGD